MPGPQEPPDITAVMPGAVSSATISDDDALMDRLRAVPLRATDDVAQTEAQHEIGKPRTSSSLYNSARADFVIVHPVAVGPAGEGGSMSLPPQPSGSGLLVLQSVSDPELRCARRKDIWLCSSGAPAWIY
jgi:hypothetical protein